MGILSALLTVGGAILGGPTGASIGGAIGGAIDQSKASSAATKAQEAAQAQAIAARQTAANQISTVQGPYTGLGANAANALGTRLGLGAAPPVTLPFPANGNTTVPTNALAPTGTPSAAPVASALTTIPGAVNALGDTSPGGMGYASAQAAPTGQTVTMGTNDPTGLTLPSSAPPGSTAANPTSAPATTPTQATNALAPTSAAYPVANGTDPGTFGNTTNPTQPAAYSAPTPFSYTQADYTASPAYAYQQDQALKATLAGASATGALQSGAAMKALQDRAQNIAYTDFTNERGFAANQNQLNVQNALNAYDTNQSVYDNNRDYLTNRFDTQTGNLFRATNVGQQAAGVVSNADLNVANGNAQSATAIGQAQAQNALSQGQIGSNLANGLVGPVSSALSGLNGGGAPIPLQSIPSPNLTPQATPQINPSSFLSIPSYGY